MIQQLKDLNERRRLLLLFKEGLLRRGIKRSKVEVITKELELVNGVIKSINITLLKELVNRHTNRRFRELIFGGENFLKVYEDCESYILIQDMSWEEYNGLDIYTNDIIYLTKNNKYSIFRLREAYAGENGLAFFDLKWDAKIERCV